MNIALIGYGKMGKAIEKIALDRGHTISARFDSKNPVDPSVLAQADVAIEFTRPDRVLAHIFAAIDNQVPIVVGTTGWYEHFDEVKKVVKKAKSGLFYATNFSVGVNLFFDLNKKLAKLMNPHLEYAVQIEEIHHTEKLDSPSGTAITLAEGLIDRLDDKNSWVNQETTNPDEVAIISKRVPHVPGTHSITYTSGIDQIEIKHTAFSREGFALGAVLAAEFIAKNKGIHTMKSLLN
ncbi:MAG TPA: 4-hydroxy-tetrahydrodipicolinate reductase [Luteibaculaceae bacterium]|jgi:4-hydroxy-tetrahydrodipicolinate reductase|nr:4-hydroxy-tetrahydrodipicolinate reductase [Luteibaculaceae bacterium]